METSGLQGCYHIVIWRIWQW